ncbi:MAG: hypothetical protein QNJ41_12510 [Xenococcaceae cyanobacterium MO_188.B32]|nr:hypothetical protein [Xenococcaceae cyanobacterium MO_188.B32]
MNYPIPANTEEILALRDRPINEEIIATAIAGVIQIARHQGQSLEDLTTQVLNDDFVLDALQRKKLSDLVTQAWEKLPYLNVSSEKPSVVTLRVRNS